MSMVVADPEGIPPDEQWYTVLYFHDAGSEDVQGLDNARRLLMEPEARASREARTAGLGGTYRRKG